MPPISAFCSTAGKNPLTMEKYGNIKTEYAIIRGSVQGAEKRQLLLTNALRKTKKQDKKKFELINLQV